MIEIVDRSGWSFIETFIWKALRLVIVIVMNGMSIGQPMNNMLWEIQWIHLLCHATRSHVIRWIIQWTWNIHLTVITGWCCSTKWLWSHRFFHVMQLVTFSLDMAFYRVRYQSTVTFFKLKYTCKLTKIKIFDEVNFGGRYVRVFRIFG